MISLFYLSIILNHAFFYLPVTYAIISLFAAASFLILGILEEQSVFFNRGLIAMFCTIYYTLIIQYGSGFSLLPEILLIDCIVMAVTSILFVINLISNVVLVVRTFRSY